MKRIIVILIIFFNINLIFSLITVKDIDSPKDLKGSNYYPLFVGAKWSYDVTGNADLTKDTREIVSVHSITDSSSDIKDLTAFKIKEAESNNEWYAFEYNGYICYYKTEIEKILPINPTLQDKWTSNSINCRISESESNMVKVEYMDEKNSKYGYQIFALNVGPKEIYEYKSNDKKELNMKLTANVAFNEQKNLNSTDKTIIAKTENKEIVENKKTEDTKEIIKENKEAEIKKEEKKAESTIEYDDNDLTKNDYITTLVKNKTYIQIGAFKVNFYAKQALLKAREAGYNAKIYQDKNGLNKVIIEIPKDANKVLKEIRVKIIKDAFIKKM